MKRFIFDKTLIRFIIVGVINTIVGTSVMLIMYNVVGASYWVSTVLNYIVGSIVSYLLNKYYTFKQKERSLNEIVKFIINISVCYLLAYGVARRLTTILLDDFDTVIRDNIAMFIGMVLFVMLNYIGQRFIVFKYNKSEK